LGLTLALALGMGVGTTAGARRMRLRAYLPWRQLAESGGDREGEGGAG